MISIANLVIPLAGEDHLLEWLDTRFVNIAKEEAWSKWLRLLRLVCDPLTSIDNDNNAEANGSNEDNNLIDVDIFDDTEPNTFDETVYTSYKCYKFLVKHIDRTMLGADKKEKILSEFVTLQSLF